MTRAERVKFAVEGAESGVAIDKKGITTITATKRSIFLFFEDNSYIWFSSNDMNIHTNEQKPTIVV